MKRKLRIAWSVAWGVVAALLVALWVRSYWEYDFMQDGAVTSANGNLYLNRQVLLEIASAGVTAVPSAPGITLPYWLLIAPTFTLSAISWMHFSLRTLLIATTLVAVGLGLIVWLTR